MEGSDAIHASECLNERHTSPTPEHNLPRPQPVPNIAGRR